MAERAEGAISLADDIRTWIESVTSSRLVGANRIPGGGTREGWFIDLEMPTGTVSKLFLRYTPTAMPDNTAFHSLATEAHVVNALADTDVPVAGIIAIHPDREAVVMERIAGDTWFYRIRDPAEQLSVAQDFIRSLAAQHRLDPRALDVAALGPVKSAREHALERIAAIRRRGTDAHGQIAPLLRVTVDWLEANVPDYDGPVVLVQGDTGPGNFLHRDGKVTAVLDWELCHFGDPMDDIAWLSLRTVQDTFTHLPDRLREYEQLSGHAIDLDRVWYYRVFAEATMTTLNPPNAERAGDEATRDIGNLMIYQQLHRRLWLEALNTAMGLGLEPPATPPAGVDPLWHGWYDDLLASLRTIAPRIADPLASQWTRGVARAVKYLQRIDIDGRQFVECELDEIAATTGTRYQSIAAARAGVDDAVRAGDIDDRQYVALIWNRVLRDDELMSSASGALHDRTWPPVQ
jgi:aminoglycoside phosphotransferase (APT) family kinase protein